MLKIITSLSIFIVFYTNTIAQSGKLISYKLVHSYSIAELDSLWKAKKIKKIIAKINYPVDVFEVIYETTWHDGSSIQASGIFFLPRKKDKEFPMMCYHHGTQILKDRKIDFVGEQIICTAFSTSGYMVAFPDYIGLGKGEKTHLYCHVESEASAAIDLLRSVKELLVKENAKQNDLLFLTGYSQGGHATLATLKVMEQKFPNEFKVTATAPMSGPYDLGGVQSEVMFKPYSHPGYLPYLIYSYQEAYNCFSNSNWAFKEEYAQILPLLFDGKHKFSEINEKMPQIPVEMLSQDFIKQILYNDTSSFKLKLAENNLCNWKPESPVMLCYCNGDEQVKYQNAIVAAKAMKTKGAKNITLRRSSKKMRHNSCAVFSSMYTKMYFDSFVKGSKKGKKGPLYKRILLSLAKVTAKK